MNWAIPISLGFARQVDKHEMEDEVDCLCDVVEEVVDLLKLDTYTLDGGECASNFAVEYLAHADAERLAEQSMFLQIVQLTYRVVA